MEVSQQIFVCFSQWLITFFNVKVVKKLLTVFEVHETWPFENLKNKNSFSSLGKFLASRPISGSGDPYKSTYNVQIKLKKLCIHRIVFYTYYNCIQNGCITAKDSINMKIYNETESIYETVYVNGTHFGRFKDDQWIKEEVFYNPNSINLDVYCFDYWNFFSILNRFNLHILDINWIFKRE